MGLLFESETNVLIWKSFTGNGQKFSEMWIYVGISLALSGSLQVEYMRLLSLWILAPNVFALSSEIIRASMEAVWRMKA